MFATASLQMLEDKTQARKDIASLVPALHLLIAGACRRLLRVGRPSRWRFHFADDGAVRIVNAQASIHSLSLITLPTHTYARRPQSREDARGRAGAAVAR
jgi:hypothetical protein